MPGSALIIHPVSVIGSARGLKKVRPDKVSYIAGDAPSESGGEAIAFISLAQLGCKLPNTKAAASKPAAQKPPPHRFVLTRFPTDNGVAFDTQTGQICKTCAWSPVGAGPNPDPVSGSTPQRMVGEFAPTCLSLYEKYPSGTGDASQNEDQQQDSK
jgi:hypothetical protein